MPKVVPYAAVQEVAKQSRTMRNPRHRFALRHRPWQIQPFLVAPVLPGETLRNLLLQSRCVSDPVKSPLVGWWLEYYFFYCKHRDLNQRDLLTSMVLDPAANLAALNDAASVPLYHYGNAPNWALKCLERVVEEYFRDEEETWNGFLIDTLPVASISTDCWMQSAMNAASFTSLDTSLVVGADDTITGSEVESMLMQYEFLRSNGVVQMTYEDYLKSYGVRAQLAEEPHRPELVRYLREWSYPTSHVDPTNGTPSSALSWAITERGDKDRYFSEPGFIFGVTIARPKMYFSKQTGQAAALMADAYSWLPAVMADDPRTSLKKIAQGAGPLPTNADVNGYWVDVRDLLVYGDQFLNFALTETDAGLVALPTTGMQKRYAVAADADALFVTPAGKNLIRQDGVVQLHIATRVQDMSARV